MDTDIKTLETLMAATVAVEYVGAKKVAFDNVARSGKVWEGNGDVQHVTPAQARVLVNYPDQWRLVPGQGAAIDAPTMLPIPGGTDTVDQATLQGKRLDKMKAGELRAYALARFGKTLGKALNTAGLLNEIEELEATAEPLPGSVQAAR